MNLLKNLGSAIAILSCSVNGIAQEVTLTQGGETSTIIKKQSSLNNFAANGNSYFVTSYSESASRVYYLESFSSTGTAQIQTKLDIPGGVFNESFSIEGVLGMSNQAYVLVGNMSKSKSSNTLSIRPIENSGSVSSSDTKLMSITYEKMMNSGNYEYSVSPDQKKLLVAGVLPFVKEMEAKVKLAVFDESLKTITETEVKLPGADTKNKQIDVRVANDGTVYLIKRTSSKNGEIVLQAYMADMKSGSVKEFTMELTAPSYIYTYVTSISNNNELIVAGTTYTRATVSTGEKKATGIFYFTNKNKEENVLSAFSLDAPVENLTARKLLLSGNTIFLAAEQFKEERIDPPTGTTNFDYNYTLIHKKEYIIGMDSDGKRKFELNLAKDFSVRNTDHQHSSAYFICNDKFTIIYNDQRQKYTTDSGYNSLIPIVVQITTDGLMQPAVPFIDKLKLPYDYVVQTAKCVQTGDDHMNFLMNKGEKNKFLKVTLK